MKRVAVAHVSPASKPGYVRLLLFTMALDQDAAGGVSVDQAAHTVFEGFMELEAVRYLATMTDQFGPAIEAMFGMPLRWSGDPLERLKLGFAEKQAAKFASKRAAKLLL